MKRKTTTSKPPTLAELKPHQPRFPQGKLSPANTDTRQNFFIGSARPFGEVVRFVVPVIPGLK